MSKKELQPISKGALRAQYQLQLRHRIQVRRILERLECHFLGTNDPSNGLPVKLTRDQISVAGLLLRKSLPDLPVYDEAAGIGSGGSGQFNIYTHTAFVVTTDGRVVPTTKSSRPIDNNLRSDDIVDVTPKAEDDADA